MTLPVRPPARRRRRTIQRASGILSRTRLAASFVLLMIAGGLHSLTTSPVFALDPASVTIDGLRYTSADAARSAMALPDGGNVFRLRTTDVETALRRLPAVRQAQVRVLLPGTVSVAVEERTPILAWRRGGTSWLADIDGVLFASASSSDVLPTIEDRRADVTPLGVGERLDALDLEVARTLAAVRPADIESDATALSVSVDDGEGWVLEAASGWRAVFGHYTVELRPASDIGSQLACLRGLLAGGEAAVETITLALSSDGCGTYRDRAEASPSPEASSRAADARPTRRP